jgi:hypothetical protein
MSDARLVAQHEKLLSFAAKSLIIAELYFLSRGWTGEQHGSKLNKSNHRDR